MPWVQVLRGLAATMVLLCHLNLWEHKVFGGAIVAPDFLRFGEAGVDLFFVISGFIMVYITPREMNDFGSWAEFLYRRLTRIFPPYWIVSAFLLVAWLHNPLLFNSFYKHQMDVGRSLLLLPQSFLPLLIVGWSLIHEVYFYFIISGILIWRTAGRVGLLCLWSLGILAANLGGWTENFSGHPVLQLISSPFSLEFQLGMLIALVYRKLLALRIPGCACALFATGGITAIYVAGRYMPDGGVYPNNNHLFRLGYLGLAAFFVVLCVVLMDASPKSIKAPRWGVLLGDASYALYLIHLPIIDVIYKAVKAILPHPNFVQAAGCFLFALIAALGAAVVFHVLLERRLIRFFHAVGTKWFKKPDLPPVDGQAKSLN